VIEKADFVIAAGGDGTAHEVVNGIAGSDVIFGIIPCGTGNDFMRSTSPFSIEQFTEAILQSLNTPIDLGRIDFENSHIYFLNIADIGFGAEVVSTMDRQRQKGIKGKFSYSLAILRTFFTYRKTLLEVQSDDFHFNSEVLMIAFCNGKALGHGLTIHPDADIQDGKLAVTKIGDVSLLTYLRNLPKLKKGTLINHREVDYWKTNKVNINSNSSFHIEADGELYMKSVQAVSIQPKAINFLGLNS
jgi:YegS/Rv2252/BmrU family lipid kinase